MNHTPNPNGSGLISANDICLSYPDSTEALRNVTLQISDHEFVALVGPSGCGKSTLLRVLSGLQPPTSGAITSATSDIGFVFQDPTLLPWRSTIRNVETLLELRGVDARERKAKSRIVLDLVGLHDSAHKYPRQLSGGMKMRASLARTLVTDPSLLLLDEPFAALDEFTRESLNDDLLAMFTAAKFSAIFVTHSISEAVYLSQRVIIISPRPGTIAHEVQVPFEYPRAPALRYSPEFAKYCGQIASLLRELQTS